jgi:hypothetical protein
LDALHLAVKGVGTDMAAHRAEVERVIADLLAKHGPVAAKPYIAHGNRRFKVHEAATDSAESPPQWWRTRCGVLFGRWLFTRHASLAAFPPDALCTKCFGRRVEAPVAEAVEESASEAATASSDSG